MGLRKRRENTAARDDEKKDEAENDGRELTACLRSKTDKIKCVVIVAAGLSLFYPMGSRPETPGNSQAQSSNEASVHVSRRFPKYGSERFVQQCNWSMSEANENGTDCTLLYRPHETWNEGVSAWVAQVASEYISAKLAGCRFLFDYGEDVDIRNVFQPFAIHHPESKTRPMNWTVPVEFECKYKDHCTRSSVGLKNVVKDRKLPQDIHIPNFRWLHRDSQSQTKLERLQQVLPGFQLESAMACSVGGLLDLAPDISQVQPDLFTRILPTLRDENAFVISIYVRTGHTDKVAKAEKGGKVAGLDEGVSRRRAFMAQPAVDCALRLESNYLSKGQENNVTFTKIVWLVVTDLPPFKQWFIDSYHNQDANQRVPVENRKWNETVIPREIVTTAARGVHSRLGRNTSTADFAEAMVDWFLIGESDLVITSHSWYSFGATASLRTARPLYDGKTCSRIVPEIDNDTGPQKANNHVRGIPPSSLSTKPT